MGVEDENGYKCGGGGGGGGELVSRAGKCFVFIADTFSHFKLKFKKREISRL